MFLNICRLYIKNISRFSLSFLKGKQAPLCPKCSNIIVDILYASYFSAFSSAHNKYIDVREKKFIYKKLKKEKRVGHCVAPVQSKMHN